MNRSALIAKAKKALAKRAQCNRRGVIHFARLNKRGQRIDIDTGKVVPKSTDEEVGITFIMSDASNKHYRKLIRDRAIELGHDPENYTDEKIIEKMSVGPPIINGKALAD